MSKKIVLYEESTTGKICARLEVDGTLHYLGPINNSIVKEYTEIGYELDDTSLNFAAKTKLNGCPVLVRA